MSYSPYWTDFNYANQCKGLYPFQYGHQTPILIRNGLFFYPMQPNLEVSIDNNPFNQNFIQKFPQ